MCESQSFTFNPVVSAPCAVALVCVPLHTLCVCVSHFSVSERTYCYCHTMAVMTPVSPSRSLEQRNEALLAEVSGLRASLEQQRRWYSVVEIKMRNAERGRADADRRNAALQSEMEQFFDTFGELGGEARKAERIVQSF